MDSHIGCIYGDSISFDRAKGIIEGLAAKGFASINCVFGVGSFTYQYNTRDTFGFALKSTLCQINNEEIMIYKAPKTDSGVKNSQRGAVRVLQTEDGGLGWADNLSLHEAEGGHLKDVFVDGYCEGITNLKVIRERLRAN